MFVKKMKVRNSIENVCQRHNEFSRSAVDPCWYGFLSKVWEDLSVYDFSCIIGYQVQQREREWGQLSCLLLLHNSNFEYVLQYKFNLNQLSSGDTLLPY